MYRDILHLNIDCFPASVEQHLRPDAKGRPVVVGMPRGDTSGVVFSASREARKLGITRDMSIRRAQRICPDGIFLQADFAVYRQVFDDFLAICSRYSPLLEPDELGCTWMDVTASRSLFGRPFDIASEISCSAYESLGLSIHTGCASNKLVARIASGIGKEFMLVIPGSEKGFLSTQPVTVLGVVNVKMEKRLNGIGINKLGDLERVPEHLLVRQFGQVGSIIKRQSMGLDFASVKAAYPPEVIIIEHMCDSALAEPADIEQSLRPMISKLAARLEKSNTLAGEVTLTLFDESASINPIPIPAYYRFKKPTRSEPLIAQALNKLMISKMQVGMEISKLKIVLSDLSNQNGHQLCIIGDSQDKNYLNDTVEQIRNRFGDDSVFLAAGLIHNRRGQFVRELHG